MIKRTKIKKPNASDRVVKQTFTHEDFLELSAYIRDYYNNFHDAKIVDLIVQFRQFTGEISSSYPMDIHKVGILLMHHNYDSNREKKANKINLELMDIDSIKILLNNTFENMIFGIELFKSSSIMGIKIDDYFEADFSKITISETGPIHNK